MNRVARWSLCPNVQGVRILFVDECPVTVIIGLETRITDKVKFMDIINLDKSLGLNGELILFSWRAAELYRGTTKIESRRKRIAYPMQASEIQVIEKLVVLSRLFLYYFPNNFEWLKLYREKSLSGFRDFR